MNTGNDSGLEALTAIDRLIAIMTMLRDKQHGCPWDLEQTIKSLLPHTIEEVYEPFLIQQGFIMRTPRGREVTELAYKHLGRIKGDIQGGLF